MASIVIASGDRRGDCYPLGRRTNVVGRAESLPIQVLDDRVSRKHMQIHFETATNRYWITDMASRNGVFVNGTRIRGETLLADRDRIRIGNTLLLFTESRNAENTVALHRFKKAGERDRRTHTNLYAHKPIHPMPKAIARGHGGVLVAV